MYTKKNRVTDRQVALYILATILAARYTMVNTIVPALLDLYFSYQKHADGTGSFVHTLFFKSSIHFFLHTSLNM